MNPQDERIEQLRRHGRGHGGRFEVHGEFPRPHGRRGPRGGGRGFPGMPPGEFPFGPDFGRGHGRGRSRQKRGDIRGAVLALLAEQPLHGYEIIREISERSAGNWRPSPGSVYPLLQQLTDEELIVESDSESHRGGKKSFTLTEKGKQTAQEFVENPPWDKITGDIPEIELSYRHAFGQLMNAVRATGDATEEQKQRAVEILNETRRKLYGILAEDTDVDQ